MIVTVYFGWMSKKLTKDIGMPLGVFFAACGQRRAHGTAAEMVLRQSPDPFHCPACCNMFCWWKRKWFWTQVWIVRVRRQRSIHRWRIHNLIRIENIFRIPGTSPVSSIHSSSLPPSGVWILHANVHHHVRHLKNHYTFNQGCHFFCNGAKKFIPFFCFKLIIGRKCNSPEPACA